MLGRLIDGFFITVAVLAGLLLVLLRSWDTLAVDSILAVIAVCIGIVILRRLLERMSLSASAKIVVGAILAVAGILLLKVLAGL